MENFLGGLVIALVALFTGNIWAESRSSKRYDEIEKRHEKDKDMWAGMFKILGEKLDALNDSINHNNLIAAGKVSVDKFDTVISGVYEALNEVKDKLNNCLGCKNYEKRG